MLMTAQPPGFRRISLFTDFFFIICTRLSRSRHPRAIISDSDCACVFLALFLDSLFCL